MDALPKSMAVDEEREEGERDEEQDEEGEDEEVPSKCGSDEGDEEDRSSTESMGEGSEYGGYGAPGFDDFGMQDVYDLTEQEVVLVEEPDQQQQKEQKQKKSKPGAAGAAAGQSRRKGKAAASKATIDDEGGSCGGEEAGVEGGEAAGGKGRQKGSRCELCERAIDRYVLWCPTCSSEFHIHCLGERFVEDSSSIQQQLGATPAVAHAGSFSSSGSSGGAVGGGVGGPWLSGGVCPACGVRLDWLDLVTRMKGYGGVAGEQQKAPGGSRRRCVGWQPLSFAAALVAAIRAAAPRLFHHAGSWAVVGTAWPIAAPLADCSPCTAASSLAEQCVVFVPDLALAFGSYPCSLHCLPFLPYVLHCRRQKTPKKRSKGQQQQDDAAGPPDGAAGANGGGAEQRPKQQRGRRKAQASLAFEAGAAALVGAAAAGGADGAAGTGLPADKPPVRR